jgi:paraquat-inducible protein B
MQQNKSYKAVGMFVFLGLLCLGGIIFYYAEKHFSHDDSQYVVMYFEESIQGLNVGSSVVFKGVEVGKVVKIRLLTDVKDATFKMPVFVSFREKNTFQLKKNQQISGDKLLKELVKKGLRARLISSNYLTGQLMIELDIAPNTPAVFQGTGEYIEIPTMISSIGMISRDLQEIPFRENMIQLGDLLQKLDDNLPPLLENMVSITEKIDTLLDNKSKETSRMINSFEATMQDMGQASVAIKNLADYLERHPEAILKGKEK